MTPLTLYAASTAKEIISNYINSMKTTGILAKNIFSLVGSDKLFQMSPGIYMATCKLVLLN